MEDGVPGFSLSSKQQSSQHRAQQMLVNAVVSNFATLKQQPKQIKRGLVKRKRTGFFCLFFKVLPSPAGCRPSSPLILAGGHPFLDCLGCEEPGWRQPSQQPEPEETPAPTCPCWGRAKEFERQAETPVGDTCCTRELLGELTPPVQVWGGPLWTVSCGGDILTRSNICLPASSRRPLRDPENDANIQREMGNRIKEEPAANTRSNLVHLGGSVH